MIARWIEDTLYTIRQEIRDIIEELRDTLKWRR